MVPTVVKATSWLLPLASLLQTITGEEEMSYVLLDNTEYIANASNYVEMSWPALEDAFASSNRSDVASYRGFDWTKPYPGAPLTGFSAHLRIADEVPFPSSAIKGDVRSDVAAISFGVPSSLMGDDGFPKSMDPSWYVCQHTYVSTVPDPTTDVDHGCSFLPTECLDGLRDSLVKTWGSWENETGSMCGGNGLEYISPSCHDALGPVTADVLGFDAFYIAKKDTSKTLVVDEVGPFSWMMGTGFNDPNNQTSYEAASNRTYLVANVFGHSAGISDAPEPMIELACMRGAWSGLETPTTASETAGTPGVPGASETSASVTPATTSARSTSSSATVIGSISALKGVALFLAVTSVFLVG